MDWDLIGVLFVSLCLLSAASAALGLTPTQTLFERPYVLLAADTVTMNPLTDPPRIILVKNAFTPSPNLVIGDLDEADFDGYSSVESQNPPLESIDPLTGDCVLNIAAGAMPYLWECTGTTGLPQTIYGYALVKNDLSLLYGVVRFGPDEQVTLTGINQSVGPVVPQLRYSPIGVV